MNMITLVMRSLFFLTPAADDMGMLGLRDLFVIAPTPSMHQQNQPISSDHHPNIPLLSSASLGVGLGIFPLLTATPCITAGVRNNDGSEQMVKSSGSGMRACRDCGNRAKRDCSHRRCRTCCKSRGYDCSTHLRSTWVPASRRRERKIMVVGVGGGGGGDGSSGSSGVKRSRIVGSPPDATTASHASTSRSADISSGHQDASFKKSLPGQVRAPAVFRCHRVTAMGNGEAEFVYQATVSIGGHVFKGFLYDKGVDEKNAFPCISQQLLDSSSSGRNK